MNLLEIKGLPEQIELIKAMGSHDPSTAMKAHSAFAAFVTPVVRELLLTLGLSNRVYKTIEFDEDSDPSIPLDLFYNQNAQHIKVWSQNMAGGLATSQVTGTGEMKFLTYRLDSAVSMNKKYVRKSRLDVVSKTLELFVNTMLIKQEYNAWAVLLKALAEGTTTPLGGSALKHVFRSGTAGVFGLAELNKLMTRNKRINESYSGETPTSVYSNGITDLFVSPEIKEDIRAFAYNPINTTAAAASGAQVVRDQYLSENMRDEIYRNAGMQSIYGVNLIEAIGLGKSKKYNTIFDAQAGSTSYTNAAGGGGAAFDGANEQILVGVDNTRGVMLRPVARQAESGGVFSMYPDTQFEAYGPRVEKIGFYGFLEEGRICLDSRALQGIIV